MLEAFLKEIFYELKLNYFLRTIVNLISISPLFLDDTVFKGAKSCYFELFSALLKIVVITLGENQDRHKSKEARINQKGTRMVKDD